MSLSPGVQGAMGLNGPGAAYPQGEVGVRYGLTERIDVGARVFIPGIEADARFGLLRALSLKHGVDLTLAPSVRYIPNFDLSSAWDGAGMVQLPLLIGVNLEGYQLVLGPRVAYLFGKALDYTTSREPLLVGSSLGVAVPIGRWFHVMPEVSVLQEPTRPPLEHVMLQAGVGFIFGGYTQE
ncbi:hypothetical protein [Archangium lipolyticum]|uniref:hypothetical protein n=1 Tax=Archangium lipolyticum TaxID=2970465 RepID=UPI00214A4DC1|nr:hypothetical protein [Archangium lipolyticum]